MKYENEVTWKTDEPLPQTSAFEPEPEYRFWALVIFFNINIFFKSQLIWLIYVGPLKIE